MQRSVEGEKRKKGRKTLAARFVFEAGKANLAMVAGYALCQLWLSLCFFAPQLFPDNASVFVYELSLAVCVVSLLPCLFISRRCESLIEDRRFILLLSVSAGVGTLIIPFSAGTSTLSLGLQVAAALLTGIPSGWLFVGWYQSFCKAGDLAGFVLSVVASSLFMYLLTAVAFVPNLSPWIMVGLAGLIPLGSGFLLQRAPKSDNYICEFGFPARHTDQRRALLLLCLGIFVVSFVDEVMRNYYLDGSDLVYYSGTFNLVVLLAKIACTVLLVSMLSDRTHHMGVVYRASFLLTMIAVLFMPYTQGAPAFLYGITNFGAFLFKIMVMIIAFSYCERYRVIPILVFALTRIAFSFDLLIGFGTYNAYVYLAPTTADLLGVMSVTLGLLVVAAYLFVFADRTSSSLFMRAERETTAVDPSKEACARLARIGALSKRETEVFALIVKGRSTTRIQEELFISKNTVNSHTRRIFQKLKVHSRQELIDLIEKTAPDDVDDASAETTS